MCFKECLFYMLSSPPGNRDTCTGMNVKSTDALDRGMFDVTGTFVSSSKLPEPIIPRFYLVMQVICVLFAFFFPKSRTSYFCCLKVCGIQKPLLSLMVLVIYD